MTVVISVVVTRAVADAEIHKPSKTPRRSFKGFMIVDRIAIERWGFFDEWDGLWEKRALWVKERAWAGSEWMLFVFPQVDQVKMGSEILRHRAKTAARFREHTKQCLLSPSAYNCRSARHSSLGISCLKGGVAYLEPRRDSQEQ